MLILYLLIVPLIVPLGAGAFCWLCDRIAEKFCKDQPSLSRFADHS